MENLIRHLVQIECVGVDDFIRLLVHGLSVMVMIVSFCIPEWAVGIAISTRPLRQDEAIYLFLLAMADTQEISNGHLPVVTNRFKVGAESIFKFRPVIQNNEFHRDRFWQTS